MCLGSAPLISLRLCETILNYLLWHCISQHSQLQHLLSVPTPCGGQPAFSVTTDLSQNKGVGRWKVGLKEIVGSG